MPVWIRLYSLHLDYWLLESLKAINNKLGHFKKNSDTTLRGKYTSFTHVYVDMYLSGALLDAFILEIYDEEWVEAVDYEHVPFRCRKCHEHGHLFRDCPLSKVENKSRANTMKDTNSFHKVVWQKRAQATSK